MECTEGKLGTRLTDGLGCDDSDNLALLDHTAGGEITSVALRADSLAGLAGKHGADFNLLDRQRVNEIGGSLPDFLTGLDDEISGNRVEDIVYGGTSENSLSERLYDLVLVLDGSCHKTAQCSAILLIDDDIMRNIHKTSGEVTCVGSLEGGIGKTLTCTVGGDEVLEHCHSLLEVGNNRVLDNLGTCRTGLLRLGHKASHSAELLDLLCRASGSGVKHHVHRVEALLVCGNLLGYDSGKLVVYGCPEVDDLVVTLVVGDETHRVVALDLLDL